MRYRNAISYAILLVIAYDIKDIANAIKKISHEISLRYRNDAISHAISHLSRIQMYQDKKFDTPACFNEISSLIGKILSCES